MAFCAVELARAGAANVLIICEGQKRGTRYIVGRYNENLSVENLSCLRLLLSPVVNTIESKTKLRIVGDRPARTFSIDNRLCFDLRQRLRKERSQ